LRENETDLAEIVDGRQLMRAAVPRRATRRPVRRADESSAANHCQLLYQSQRISGRRERRSAVAAGAVTVYFTQSRAPRRDSPELGMHTDRCATST
jgi:hypothetical protein